MLLFIVILSFGYFFFYHFYWKRRNLPPGPLPLPFIGNFHSIVGHSTGEKVLLEYRKKYGPLFTFWQGRVPVVVVSNYKLMQEMFLKDGDNFLDKGFGVEFLRKIQGGDGGIFLANGDIWRENRRFALHVLRNMGLGKNLMEERIVEEFQTLASRINRAMEKSDEVEIAPLLDTSIGSIINCLMFGYRYTDDKLPEFFDLNARARPFMQVLGDPLLAIVQFSGSYLSIFKRLPVFKQKFDLVEKTSAHLLDFFRQRAKEYIKQNLDKDIHAEATDYTQAFLQEKRKREEAGDPTAKTCFSDLQLVLMLFNLWVGGQETTANTSVWCFVYLLHNPEVQQKAQEELDRVIGSDRLITVADKPKLPYISALINETLRIANLVPFSIPKIVARDTVVNGVPLKRGTWVVPQLSMLMYDPEIYPEPNKFKPERFIDAEGKLMKSDELLPFSIGKRACLGEGLARMELFLFIGNLLNQYKFSATKQLPDLTRNIGFTVRPLDFKCHIEKRFK